MYCYFSKKVELFQGGQLKHYFGAWSALTSDKEILDIISGDKLEFNTKTPPRRSQVRPIHLSIPHQTALNAEIERLLLKNIITVSTHEEGEYVSQIFPVTNSDNSIQMILNLKSLNESIQFLHFKMDSIHSVLHNITPGCFMASLDLKSAYYSVPIAPEFQKYLKFEWNGQLYQFLCYPNGLGTCPRKFTKVTKVPLAELRKDNSIISGFIDDFHLQGHDYEDCNRTLKNSILLLDKLGFVIHPEKSAFIPSQRIVYIGFVIDSVALK